MTVSAQSLARAFAALALAEVAVVAQAQDPNMKAFPPAEAGQVRFVIAVPKARDESSLRVELAIGKVVQTDAANRRFFGGKLDAETIPGWGFTRYVLRELGPMAGTLLAWTGKVDAKVRVVALTGSADDNTPPSLARAWIDALRTRGIVATCVELAGDSHNGAARSAAVRDAIAAFVGAR